MKDAFLRVCFRLGQLCSGQLPRGPVPVRHVDAANASSHKQPQAQAPPATSSRAVTIATCINRFYLRGNRHEVEDGVRDCLNEIAKHEGWSNKAPNWDYLYRWEARKDISVQYLELSKSLRQFFEDRRKQLERQKQEREEAEFAETLSQNQDLVDKFYQIAERKVSQLDDYGEENWDALAKEIEIVSKKFEARGVTSVATRWRLEETLRKNFIAYHTQQKPVRAPDVTGLSGVEFETHIAKLLRNQGYSVQGTPVTGDQGADLVIQKDAQTIVVQAKRYAGPVGNKAVQEVIGAVSYYGASEGWVITNSTFTPQAKALAQKSNVRLFDGFDLKNNPIFSI